MPKTHELYYGGQHMADRSIWTDDGQSYWPNATATVDTPINQISAEFTHGNAFNAHRRLYPRYLNGDVAALEYLNRNAARPVSGDVINLFFVPQMHNISAVTTRLEQLPAGLEGVVELFNLSTGQAVANSAVTVDSTKVGTVQTKSINATFDVPTMVRLRVTSSPATDVDWETLLIEVNVAGIMVYDPDTVIDVSIPHAYDIVEVNP